MNDELIELARRAVASPHWRWMPGMLVMSDPEAVPRPLQMQQPATSALRARVFSAQLGTWYGVWEYDADDPDCEGEQCGGGDLPGTLPDLADPATLGCLLALVREPWGEFARTDVAPGAGGWRIEGCCKNGNPRDTTQLGFTRATEAAALVAALEAAPAPTPEERWEK